MIIALQVGIVSCVLRNRPHYQTNQNGVENVPNAVNEASGFRRFRMIVINALQSMREGCTFEWEFASIQNNAI